MRFMLWISLFLLSLPSLGARCPSSVDALANQVSALRVEMTYEDPRSPLYREIRDQYFAKSLELDIETERVDRCLGIYDEDPTAGF